MINVPDLRLNKTCSACPEQYDVYYEDQQIGYIRRRWECIWVICPNVHGEVIDEREDDLGTHSLALAMKSIVTWFNDKGK